MAEAEDRERPRVGGLPLGAGGLRRIGDTEPRVLGLPQSWFAGKAPDLAHLRHPLMYLRWRQAVRRLGPYAPSYEQFQQRGERDE